MGIGTLFTLFVVPAIYLLFNRARKPVAQPATSDLLATN
jgi:hypothetical protein